MSESSGIGGIGSITGTVGPRAGESPVDSSTSIVIASASLLKSLILKLKLVFKSTFRPVFFDVNLILNFFPSHIEPSLTVPTIMFFTCSAAGLLKSTSDVLNFS